MLSLRFRENLSHGTPAFPLFAYNLKNQGTFVFPCHWHPEFEFILVESGVLALQRGQRNIIVRSGEATALGPEELHTGQAGPEGCHCRPIVFRQSFVQAAIPDATMNEWFNPLISGQRSLPDHIGPATPNGPRCLELLKEIIRLADQPTAGAELLIKGGLLQVFGWLAAADQMPKTSSDLDPRPVEDARRLRLVLDYIHRHLAEEISVAQLAAVACLSRSAYSRFFQAHTGETTVEYINRSRVTRAIELINQSGLSVSAAASATGFNNLSYFTRSFRRYTGNCPSKIRPRNRQ